MHLVPGWARGVRLTQNLAVDGGMYIELPGSVASRLAGLEI